MTEMGEVYNYIFNWHKSTCAEGVKIYLLYFPPFIIAWAVSKWNTNVAKELRIVRESIVERKTELGHPVCAHGIVYFFLLNTYILYNAKRWVRKVAVAVFGKVDMYSKNIEAYRLWRSIAKFPSSSTFLCHRWQMHRRNKDFLFLIIEAVRPPTMVFQWFLAGCMTFLHSAAVEVYILFLLPWIRALVSTHRFCIK